MFKKPKKNFTSGVHVLPCLTPNTIILRVSINPPITVASIEVAAFTKSERLANTKVTVAACQTVIPELHSVCFRSKCQEYFSPNGKFGWKELSSL